MEQKSESETETQKPVISRRRFLIRAGQAGLIGVGLLTGIIPSAKTTKENLVDLERAIEQEFDIELMTLNEHARDVGQHEYTSEPALKLRWDTKRLRLLRESLQLLPKHFYQRSDKGEKLRITLSDWRGTCCGRFETAGYKYHVALAAPFLDESPGRGLIHIVHEFTHLQDPTNHIPPNRIEELKKIDPELDGWSTWWDEIDQILGEKFADVNFQIYESLKTREDELRRQLGISDREIPEYLDKESKDKLLFYDQLSYGLLGGDYRPNEFIAVMSETYLGGEDNFKKRYGEFFDQEVVDKLYQFTKEKVFRGKEYSQFPIK